MNLADRIVLRSHELGFARVGFTPAGPLAHADRFDRWLRDGMHGDMSWIERNTELRVDARRLEPGTRTVIALAAPYGRPEAADARLGRIAAYAMGDDYHDILRARLNQLGAFIAAESGSAVRARGVTDSAPLLERNVAVDAGLGWIGKSAMVLHPSLGSYFFLAELLVDIEVGEPPPAHPDRCGRCTRCIDQCPTGAIVSPGVVDARRCISYFTIELRGPIPRQWRSRIGDHLFGCDICQEVCPWNTRPAPVVDSAFAPRATLENVDAASVIGMSANEFNSRFRGSPIARAKRRGLARNAAVVLGNTADRRWLGVLIAALEEHDEPLVRGHAAWAIGRLGGDAATVALDRAASREIDAYVVDEIESARRDVT